MTKLQRCNAVLLAEGHSHQSCLILQHATAGIATLIRSDHCCAVALVNVQYIWANFSALSTAAAFPATSVSRLVGPAVFRTQRILSVSCNTLFDLFQSTYVLCSGEPEGKGQKWSILVSIPMYHMVMHISSALSSTCSKKPSQASTLHSTGSTTYSHTEAL